MRFIIGFLLIIALIGGGSYLYWQKQARKVEKAVTALLDQLNELSEAKSGLRFIEYDTINVSGFPFKMTFTMNDPIITTALSAKTDRQKISEKHRIDGSISIGTDWQGNSFYFSFQGARKSHTIIDKHTLFPRMATVSSPFHCTLDLHSAQNSFAQKPYQSVQNFSGKLTDIKQVHCKLSGYDLTSADKPTSSDTQAKHYYHLDDAEISWIFEPESNNDRAHAEFSIQLHNAQIGQMIEPYFEALSPLWKHLGIAKGIEKLPRHFFTRLGANNISLRGHYDGPRTKVGFNTPFELALDEFSLENTLLKGSTQFSIRSTEATSAQQQLTIEATNSMGFTDRYDTLYREKLIDKFIQQRPIITLLGMSIDLRQLSNAQVIQLGQELLPSLAALSPLTFSLKAFGNINTPSTTVLTSSITAQLDNLALETKMWKLQFTGNANVAQTQLPTSKAILQGACTQCDLLLHELKTILRTFDKWRMISLHTNQPMVTKKFLSDLDRFMNALSAGRTENLSAIIPSFETLSFKVEFAQLTPLINGLSLQQISTMFDEFLAPHVPLLQQPSIAPSPAYYSPMTPPTQTTFQ